MQTVATGKVLICQKHESEERRAADGKGGEQRENAEIERGTMQGEKGSKEGRNAKGGAYENKREMERARVCRHGGHATVALSVLMRNNACNCCFELAIGNACALSLHMSCVREREPGSGAHYHTHSCRGEAQPLRAATL